MSRSIAGVIIALLALSMSLAFMKIQGYPLTWLIVVVASASAFGSLSLLIYARRLRYLAAASPHAAFLAAGAGILIANTIGGNVLFWTLVIGILLVYAAGYMSYKGADVEDSTSLLVAFSSSIGALVIYYVMTRYSYGVSIVSIVIGDPLLASKELIYYTALIGVISIIYVILTGRETIYIGTDPEDAKLSGLKIWFYDWLLYTFIGMATIGLVRAVGFVLEHVFLLIPGAIAALICRGIMQGITLSVAVSVLSASLGLVLAIILDLAPSASVGAILIVLYMVIFLLKREK